MLLDAKKAIVTGGARGIGKEIVTKFLNEGASVYFIDLQPSEFLSEYESIASSTGATVSYKECNVAEEAQVEAVTKEILDEAGEIDVSNDRLVRFETNQPIDEIVKRTKLCEWDAIHLTDRCRAANVLIA